MIRVAIVEIDALTGDFEAAPTGSDTAPAAVAAFERVLTTLLDEESTWIEEVAAESAPS
jgi:hypothetical protein